MQSASEQIIESGFGRNVFNDLVLKQIFSKSQASRYGLINKAIKKGEIIKLRRGLYVLNNKYSQAKFSKLYLANQIMPSSYVSLEIALAYHGWIPEQVLSIESLSNKGRKKTFKNNFGEFKYTPIHVSPYKFLTGVNREDINGQKVLIATAIRALIDLIYVRKINYKNLSFLTESLRIELDDLQKIKESDFKDLQSIYSSQRVQRFLMKLEKELL